MKVTYTRKGDYLIPNLYLEKDEELWKNWQDMEYQDYTLLLKINKHFMKHLLMTNKLNSSPSFSQ